MVFKINNLIIDFLHKQLIYCALAAKKSATSATFTTTFTAALATTPTATSTASAT